MTSDRGAPRPDGLAEGVPPSEEKQALKRWVKTGSALTGVAQRGGRHSTMREVAGLAHKCISPSLSPSLPLSLKNKFKKSAQYVLEAFNKP